MGAKQSNSGQSSYGGSNNKYHNVSVTVYKRDTCPWCVRYKAGLSHPSIAQQLPGLKIDFKNPEQSMGMQITGVPQTVVQTANKTIDWAGYIPPEDFIAKIQSIAG